MFNNVRIVIGRLIILFFNKFRLVSVEFLDFPAFNGMLLDYRFYWHHFDTEKEAQAILCDLE